MRERFAAVCVEPFGGLEGHHLPFASFSHKLGGLRWQVVTEFCRGVTSQCLVFFWWQCGSGTGTGALLFGSWIIMKNE